MSGSVELREKAPNGKHATSSLVIVYATQSGNAQYLSINAEKKAIELGVETKRMSIDEIKPADLATFGHLLLISSTYNDAEMPDAAVDFWDELAESDISLEGLRYGVLALGDSEYEDFCWAGGQFDTRLEEMGAMRIVARAECDIDFDETSQPWLADALEIFAASLHGDDIAAQAAASVGKSVVSSREASRWNRSNPFVTKILEVRELSGSESAKHVVHLELDLSGSGIEYLPGDSISVVVSNQPSLVDELISTLGVEPMAMLPVIPGSVRAALTHDLEIRLPTRRLVEVVAAATHSEELTRVLAFNHEAWAAWLWGKDVVDILRYAPSGSVDPNTFVSALAPLAHRTYSISSSPTVNPERVALTVSLVEYECGGREHRGAASAHLRQAVEYGQEVRIFLSPNPAFRVPADDVPIIMVGPGTGIAPFRAFLQDRASRNVAARSWLFFGDRTSGHDWLYKDELLKALEDGTLTKLNTAFSRDQEEKRYVQHAMLEASAELYSWVQEGAHIYVCGDMQRMSRDVETVLLEVFEQNGGMSPQAARSFLDDLTASKRYQLDVY